MAHTQFRCWLPDNLAKASFDETIWHTIILPEVTSSILKPWRVEIIILYFVVPSLKLSNLETLENKPLLQLCNQESSEHCSQMMRIRRICFLPDWYWVVTVGLSLSAIQRYETKCHSYNQVQLVKKIPSLSDWRSLACSKFPDSAILSQWTWASAASWLSHSSLGTPWSSR